MFPRQPSRLPGAACGSPDLRRCTQRAVTHVAFSEPFLYFVRTKLLVFDIVAWSKKQGLCVGYPLSLEDARAPASSLAPTIASKSQDSNQDSNREI